VYLADSPTFISEDKKKAYGPENMNSLLPNAIYSHNAV